VSQLLIRADAGPRIGAGHLLRCVALAQAWRREGGEAAIASRCQAEPLRRRVETAGVELVPLAGVELHPADPRETLDIAARRGPAWIVLDGYQFDPAYQRCLRTAGHRLLIIDDTAHQPAYEAEILLNQNLGAEALAYQTSLGTKRLLGPRYALLRTEFQEWRDRRREIRVKARRLLVTLGGSDPENVTLKVIHALNQVPECEARIVIGPSNPHTDALVHAAKLAGPECALLRDVADMPAMMGWADAAVSAAGSTCWELAFMGVPSLVVVVAENQRSVAEGLARAEAAINLGWHEDVSSSRIGQAVCALMESSPCRKALAERARPLVDGEGSNRVVAEMRGQPLRLRRVRDSDCRQLWEWANDQSVRAASFVTDPIPWKAHVAWFAGKLRDPAVQIYIAIDRAENPIGQVRFEQDGADATISVALDRNFRGMGLGSTSLDLAVRRFFRERPSAQLVHAYIRPGNEHSVRAFMKAGFEQAGATVVGEQPALHFIRHRGEV